MKRSTQYVGLDVHQATTVVSVREESGRILARSILPTEEAAFLEFFGTMRGSVQGAFEEGTQAQWLHDLLSPRVHRVLVCDRRGEKKYGNKGDVADADQLSQDLLRGRLRAVYHGSGHRVALKRCAQGAGPHLRERRPRTPRAPCCGSRRSSGPGRSALRATKSTSPSAGASG